MKKNCRGLLVNQGAKKYSDFLEQKTVSPVSTACFHAWMVHDYSGNDRGGGTGSMNQTEPRHRHSFNQTANVVKRKDMWALVLLDQTQAGSTLKWSKTTYLVGEVNQVSVRVNVIDVKAVLDTVNVVSIISQLFYQNYLPPVQLKTLQNILSPSVSKFHFI